MGGESVVNKELDKAEARLKNSVYIMKCFKTH